MRTAIFTDAVVLARAAVIAQGLNTWTTVITVGTVSTVIEL